MTARLERGLCSSCRGRGWKTVWSSPQVGVGGLDERGTSGTQSPCLDCRGSGMVTGENCGTGGVMWATVQPTAFVTTPTKEGTLTRAAGTAAPADEPHAVTDEDLSPGRVESDSNGRAA